MNRNFDKREHPEMEQDVWDLLKKRQEETVPTHAKHNEEEIDRKFLPKLPDTLDTDFADVPLIFPLDDKEPTCPDVEVIAPPQADEDTNQEEQGKPRTFGEHLRGLFPSKTDTVSENIRKCVFLVCLPLCIVSLCFLSFYMIIEPKQVENSNQYYASLYTEQSNDTTTNANNYPDGMQLSFRRLYDVNPDIAGWLSFNSDDTDTFLHINLPVVHCNNNDTYLSRSFDGKKSRSGTLFFDASNVISKDVDNKVSIIYGHNMTSGAMFAGLNKLVNNLYRARAATTISLNTLYGNQYYQVFAILVSDEDATNDTYFPYLRTAFSSEEEFLDYVRNLRARSMYDYPVDISGDDQLLILSTCTNKSQVKLGNGRLVVVARRIKKGESMLMNTNKIVQNEDVIMPFAWYTAQQLSPHAFYTEKDYTLGEENNVVTTLPLTDDTDVENTTTKVSDDTENTTVKTSANTTTTTKRGNKTTSKPSYRTSVRNNRTTTTSSTAATPGKTVAANTTTTTTTTTITTTTTGEQTTPTEEQTTTTTTTTTTTESTAEPAPTDSETTPTEGTTT